ncbi:gamma-glutamyl-gamma-aminobutyrate hydrolase family protein [Enterococcus sp. LJL98]
MKPKIGIVGNEKFISTEKIDFWMSYTTKGYIDGIQQAGGLPFILPIGEPTDAKAAIDTLDRLIIAGGQDIQPQLYQQEPSRFLGETNPARDEFELALILEAAKQEKPILGICRGMQLLNVAFGGSLCQDLSLHPSATLPHVQEQSMNEPSHLISIAPKSWLDSFLPSTYLVNSAHHQAIDQLASTFKISATAADGVIESIEAKDSQKKILGVQWHPELTRDKIAREQAIFDYFIHF